MNTSHKRYPGSQLGPGSLAAHGRFSLMLLHSCPDMVQRVPLRETKTSAPLTRGSFTRKYPRQNITPAVADCRYRAPLSPRLCGPVKYTWTGAFCQVAKSPGDSELSANFFPDFTKSYSSAYLNSGIFVIGNFWFSNGACQIPYQISSRLSPSAARNP